MYATEPWDGLTINDPFHTAKSAVSFVVEDAEQLKFDVSWIINIQPHHMTKTNFLFQNSKSFEITGDDFFFEESIYSKVMDHSHLAVNIDLVNQLDDIETSIGGIGKSQLSGSNTLLSSKDKGDREFLSQIAYLQGLADVVSAGMIHTWNSMFNFFFVSACRHGH